ncbi:MAG: HEPN domain-containing protein [Bacteroidales bacterium]
MDIRNQTEYLITSAIEDLDTAELLINNNKILYALFLCHLSIEKAIKSHVAKDTGKLPPRVHNLSYLIEKTTLKLSEEQLLL